MNQYVLLNVYGDPKGRAGVVVDFMLALQRPPDTRVGDHDEIDADDQLYWKMP